MKGLLNEKTNSTITMKESKISFGAGIGLLAGIIIGNATDNVGLWIALGLCFGDNFLADDVHYNEDGAEFIADRYYKTIINLLD